MISKKRSAFSSYLTKRLSEGRVVFTAEEAQTELGIGQGALLDAAERQQRYGHLIRPRGGFYVIVPPQFHGWGAPPPPWYIDAMMAHSELTYYVGLLTAAELHGASHQAVMEFQVVADRQLGSIRAGRSNIVFRFRKNMQAVATGIETRNTDTGQMNVAGVELTALDLVRYPRAVGGFDHIATVLLDLGDRIDGARLTALAGAFERSVGQRLGHLLDRLGFSECTDGLRDALARKKGMFWVELDPLDGAREDFPSAVVERDERWRVRVRTPPEPDQ